MFNKHPDQGGKALCQSKPKSMCAYLKHNPELNICAVKTNKQKKNKTIPITRVYFILPFQEINTYTL
jgi:hypothetical protein